MSMVTKISKGGKKTTLNNIKMKKTKTVLISNHRNRTKSFSRRKDTFLQKGLDLHVATNAEVMVVVAPSGNRYCYNSNLASPFQEQSAAVNMPFVCICGGNKAVNQPSPFSPKKGIDVSTQTTESFFKELYENLPEVCRICGEEKVQYRAVWLGCSRGGKCNAGSKCNFWVHALCLGLACKTQSALSKLKYHCPKHVGTLI